ncbi:fibronectin type III domain-containing protein [Oceanihabitans sp. IOP_32]|uniref:fibronectin type III domain-containing protein n=1 Tax=Oceanihabitans sp. IOP_32 TaxID=2529032 RepID=UPI001D17372A|nr:fibronectin type III domain-containing protein [Oceanihabitans sp. IOP_32]
MKKITLLLFIISHWIVAQETPQTPAVQVLARPQEDKILLRWAVDTPLAWKQANAYGFLIERSTISRNGAAVIPIEKKQLLATPLKPQPLAAWETLAQADNNAAVLAQALYGERFETTAPSNDLGTIYAVNDELEQRFTFGLLAAEQNYEAAKLAGWGFEDNTVKPGENYLYSISVAIPQEDPIVIENGSVYTSLDMFEELPKPIGFVGSFGDGAATLRWNFHLLQHLYTNYSIERSDNNQDFKPLSGVPIFNAQDPKQDKSSSLSYIDSIPNNKVFYYRVKGKTAFGETGPYSDIASGKAVKSLGFVPRISRKEIPTDSTAVLYWDFDEKGNDLITGFEVRRAHRDRGPFETVKNNIPPTARKTTVSGLKRSNYFTIVAIGKNNTSSESYTAFVQPIDSMPPAAPKGLKATLDTLGILKLKWHKNMEDDLKGYRIFTANNPDVEFTEVTKATFIGETFIDTIPIKNLNDKIYFKLKAEDKRYNRSKFSELLVVDQPNVIAPSPPIFKNYRITPQGIELEWIPSSSKGVIAHVLYRKNNRIPEALWEEIAVSENIIDSLYMDKSLTNAGIYTYTMVAKNEAGLESTPTDLLTITWKGKAIKAEAIKFSGLVNRELRFINLSWKIKDITVSEYRLYRGKAGNQLQLYKTLNGETTGYNDTNLEINSDYWYGLQLVLPNGRTSAIKEINLKY